MLHEILFMLWHNPEHLYSEKNEDGDIINLKEFLHPGEYEILERIVNISLSYHKIQDFIRSIENTTSGCSDTEKWKHGNYSKAFCKGLNDALLQYRKDIIYLEEKVLKNNQLRLSYIFASLKKYISLFDILKSVLMAIEGEQVYGCRFVDRLHIHMTYGNPMIMNAAKIMSRSVNTIFYHQLGNWLIYGNLVDFFDEFFIIDGKCDDDNFLYPKQLDSKEQLESSTEVNASQNNQVTINKSSPYDQLLQNQFRVRKFSLNTDLLPSIMPLNLAETILFIGRVVWIIRNDPRSQRLKHNRLNTCELTSAVGNDVENIWQGNSLEIFRKIQKLEIDEFNANVLDKVIQECNLTLSKFLLNLLVNESHLMNHLQLIRDYYCLGRGELFHRFIVLIMEQYEHVSSANEYEYSGRNFNYLFQETARKIYTESDKTYERFKIRCSKTKQLFGTETSDMSSQLLSEIEMYLMVEWPLHIVFHPKLITFYNRLFSFLLLVKKTQIDLDDLWLEHMNGKQKIDRDVWRLRHYLMFVVNNIQYYLQVDVIESEFSILKNAVLSANDFGDVFHSHSIFIANLLSKSFLMTCDEKSTEETNNVFQMPRLHEHSENKIYKLIMNIMNICGKFTSKAREYRRRGGGGLSAEMQASFEEMRTEVDFCVESLLKSLYTLNEQISGHHLWQLMLRLDYNKWYTRTKTNLNFTVIS